MTAAGFNPELFVWARETAGLSREEAAQKIQLKAAYGKTAAERLSQIERGEQDPSRAQLRRMAKAYHRPLGVFYLRKPPPEGDHGAEFRTLPTTGALPDEPLLQALVRNVHARQQLLRAALEEDEDLVLRNFVGSSSTSDGVAASVRAIAQLTSVDHADFYNEQNPDAAFRLLRAAVERIGVFVLLIGNLGSHHTGISVETFRGLSIADDIAPMVVCNANDRHGWPFTLLHEFTHLLLGQSGVGNRSDSHQIEKFCNDVAGEFLLPVRELEQSEIQSQLSLSETVRQIDAFAKPRNLSRLMVAYRASRAGQITEERYHQLQSDSRDQVTQVPAEERESSAGGPSFYVVHRHRLGNALTATVQELWRSGDLSTMRAAQVLNVKPLQVARLLQSASSS